MIDDETIASPVERLAYQEGLLTIERFDPNAQISAVTEFGVDGVPRSLTMLEIATNQLFSNQDRHRIHAMGSVVFRELMPVDMKNGGWIQQSLHVGENGVSIQLSTRYTGMLPWYVKHEYLRGNGTLFSGIDGRLVHREYGSDVLKRIGFIGATKLLLALKNQSI